jgi:hypothetical protein
MSCGGCHLRGEGGDHTRSPWPAVGLVSGGESFGQACLRVVVKLASVTVQLGNDRLELGPGLQEFQAFGDQLASGIGRNGLVSRAS